MAETRTGHAGVRLRRPIGARTGTRSGHARGEAAHDKGPDGGGRENVRPASGRPRGHRGRSLRCWARPGAGEQGTERSLPLAVSGGQRPHDLDPAGPALRVDHDQRHAGTTSGEPQRSSAAERRAAENPAREETPALVPGQPVAPGLGQTDQPPASPEEHRTAPIVSQPQKRTSSPSGGAIHVPGLDHQRRGVGAKAHLGDVPSPVVLEQAQLCPPRDVAAEREGQRVPPGRPGQPRQYPRTKPRVVRREADDGDELSEHLLTRLLGTLPRPNAHRQRRAVQRSGYASSGNRAASLTSVSASSAAGSESATIPQPA